MRAGNSSDHADWAKAEAAKADGQRRTQPPCRASATEVVAEWAEGVREDITLALLETRSHLVRHRGVRAYHRMVLHT
jgi:hypothetical protein